MISSRAGGRWTIGHCSPCPSTERLALSRIRVFAAVLLGTALSAGLLAEDPSHAELEALLQQKNWARILELTSASPPVGPNLLYYRGIALAGVGRLEEAETALQSGYTQASGDRARFLVELAGVRFKQGQLSQAIADMQRARALGYGEDYAYDFLGALYFLDGNLPAALKYWNRIEKPRLRSFEIEPRDILDPVMLDRLVPFSAGEALQLSQLEVTQARLEQTGLFSGQRFALQARDDGDFDLTLHLSERTGLNNGARLHSLIYSLRDLPYSTVHGRLTNLGRSGYSVSSALRWQTDNRRFVATLSAPLRRDPSFVYSVGVDVRDELWSPPIGEPGVPANLQTVRANARLRSVLTENWSWSTGVEAARSEARSPVFLDNSEFRPGVSVASEWGITRRLVSLPENRFRFDGETRWKLGRFSTSDGSLFSQLEIEVTQDWIPRRNWRITSQGRLARTWGVAPFDQLFRLGMDRDSLPLLRAHRFRLDGRRGLGPIGTGYALLNSGVSRTLYRNGLFTVSAGPFVDTAKVFDPLSAEHRAWLCDAGLEMTVGVLGAMDLKVSYGVDLRTGKSLLYSRTSP